MSLDSLEIYFRDSRSLLVVFLDRKQRRESTSRLSHLIGRMVGDPGSAGLMKSPFTGKLSAKVSSAFGSRMMAGSSDELAIAQRKWQSREISNVSSPTCNQVTYSQRPLAVHIPQYPQPNLGAYS